MQRIKYEYETKAIRSTVAEEADVNICVSSASANAVTCGPVQAGDLLPTPAR